MLYKSIPLNVRGRLSAAFAELEALVDAIERRDIDKAAELSELHSSTPRITFYDSFPGKRKPLKRRSAKRPRKGAARTARARAEPRRPSQNEKT